VSTSSSPGTSARKADRPPNASWRSGSLSTDIELLHAGDVTALELFQVRYSVEPLAAAMAAEGRTAADVRGMDATLAKSLRRAITSEEFVAVDFEFHRDLMREIAKYDFL
jgi:DNA-binding FadR family transcriptional regulator